jgi:hypothetical protein
MRTMNDAQVWSALSGNAARPVSRTRKCWLSRGSSFSRRIIPERRRTNKIRARWQHREKVEHSVEVRVARLHHAKLEDAPLKKLLMIGALAFAATTVAESAIAAEFYVVRDSTTKKCTVVDTKPTTTTTTVVDNGTYKTKTEAESGMKTTKVCSE